MLQYYTANRDSLASIKGITYRQNGRIVGTEERPLLEDLEEILFASDLGVATTQELIDKIQDGVALRELDKPEKLKEALKDNILSFLNISV